MRKSEVRKIGSWDYKLTQLPNRIVSKLYLDVGPRILPIIMQLQGSEEEVRARFQDPGTMAALSAQMIQSVPPDYLDHLIDVLLPCCEVRPKEGPQAKTLWLPLADCGGTDYMDNPLEVLAWVRAALEVQLGDFLSSSASILSAVRE